VQQQKETLQQETAMYVSVRRYTIGAGSIDALAHRLEEEFAPAISQQPGFLGYLAIATGEGTVETVSVFVDPASGRRSDQLAAEYVAQHLREFEPACTEVTGGDVLASRVTPAMLEAVHWWRAQRVRARLAGQASPVLVVGATSRTGRLIVDRLLERGVPVCALVRDAARGRALLPRTTRLFVGDLRQPETLAASMEGVLAMIVATSGGTERDNSPVVIDYFGTEYLMREAVRAGVGLVVYVSSIYANRPDHYLDVEPTSLGWKARAEEVVRASGVPYCIVRAGWLTDEDSTHPLALSQGDIGEGNLSRADLADVCAELLFLADARGKTFEVVAARSGAPKPLASAIAELKPDDVPGAAAGLPA
jgi:uncharacterized protein YbjT (DUF2867 family)